MLAQLSSLDNTAGRVIVQLRTTPHQAPGRGTPPLPRTPYAGRAAGLAERRGRLPCWACSGAAAAAVQQPLQQPRQCKLWAGRWRWSTHCTDREQFLSPTRIAQCLTSYRHIIGITRLQSRPRGLFSARPHTHRHQPCPSRPPSLLPRVGSKSTWVRTRSFACSTVSQTAVDGFRGDETAETVALRWRVLSVVIH